MPDDGLQTTETCSLHVQIQLQLQYNCVVLAAMGVFIQHNDCCSHLPCKATTSPNTSCSHRASQQSWQSDIKLPAESNKNTCL